MYYGHYNVIQSSLPGGVSDDGTIMHAKCWVLGDKLLCNGFKNYALSRLYKEHATGFGKGIATSTVRYALENSTPDSRLGRYYRHLLLTHFENSSRVVGTAGEWDALLLEHSDVRLALLEKLRIFPSKMELVQPEKVYMD